MQTQLYMSNDTKLHIHVAYITIHVRITIKDILFSLPIIDAAMFVRGELFQVLIPDEQPFTFNYIIQ